MFRKILTGIRHPHLAARSLNRLYYSSRNPSGYNESGIDIIEEDWDNLLILDACRYDVFEQHSSLRGNLESRISRGAATPEFLSGNFKDKTLHDTIYITANPQFYRKDVNCEFHDVDNVWRNAGWHKEHGTVLPETVTEHAINAQERYPKKRLIVHYMQPHYPFIDSDIGVSTDVLKDESTNRHIWMQLQTGELEYSPERVRKAYTANLRRAIPHVRTALDALDGKSVVTSDHGNLFGERIGPIPVRTWGHPRQTYVNSLIEVPWLIVDADERPEMEAELPEATDSDVGDDLVESRLADLGYLE